MRRAAGPLRKLPVHGHVSGKRKGVAIHNLIAELARGPERPPAPPVIARAAQAHSRSMAEATYRLALYQQLLTGASLFFRLFDPGPCWSLAGDEISLPDGSGLDLAWSSPAGVLVDEIKGGRMATRGEQRELEGQLERYLRVGRLEFADQFLGIRVVLLGAPRRSFLAGSDGTRTSLEWERSA